MDKRVADPPKFPVPRDHAAPELDMQAEILAMMRLFLALLLIGAFLSPSAWAQQPAITDAQIEQARLMKLQSDATWFSLMAQKLQSELIDAQKRVAELTAKCGDACKPEPAKAAPSEPPK